MPEEVLHARAAAAHKRSVAERLVLRALLPDHEHAHAAVGEPAAKKHRPEMPAELVPAAQRTAQAAVVRRLGEETCPFAVGRGSRVELPGVASIEKEVRHTSEQTNV